MAARRRAAGKGSKPVTLPRPGHADLAGSLKYGLDDVRDALERASARQTAVAVAAGSVAKALLAQIGIAVEGRVVSEELEARIDEARADRDTVGGVVEVVARGVPPGLGSYASKDERLDARLAAALMGIQAVKGVEVGDGFELAGRRGSEAHDEILADADGTLYRETNRAGGDRGRRLERRAGRRARGDEAAADADAAAALGRPRDRRGRARRWSSGATSPRSRRWPSSPRPPSPSSSPGRPARSSAATRSRTSSAPGGHTWSASRGARARPAPRARRLHGRGQVDARRAGRRAARPAVRRPRPRARAIAAADDLAGLRRARRGGVPRARVRGRTRDACRRARRRWSRSAAARSRPRRSAARCASTR